MSVDEEGKFNPHNNAYASDVDVSSIDVWFEPTTTNAVCLDLAEGSIAISENIKGVAVFKQGDTEIRTATAVAIIRQTDNTTATANTITIGGVNCNLTICDLNVVCGDKCSPLKVETGSSLHLTSLGSTTLTAGWGAAGIQVSGDADVTIGGSGSITAIGGLYGAGIGGGYNTDGGEIAILEGTIIAKGGDCAAGIGCGRNGDYVSIVISGGNVTSTGGELNGAGIGGGRGSVLNAITINGGVIVASGGNYGAGIGQGHSGKDGLITITGGEVTAISGGCSAPGIGDGYEGSGSIVIISGGTVSAEGCWSADIKADSVTISDQANVTVSPDSSHPGVLETIFIDAQPVSSAAHVGKAPKVSVLAHANSGLVYEWQKCTDGDNWFTLDDATAELQIAMTNSLDGAEFRCILRNGWGNEVYTDTFRLYVLDFTQQPTNVDANLGDTISIAVVSSCPNVKYQWQKSYDDGQNWFEVSGETFSALIVNATLSESNAKYRCIITATNGDWLASDPAQITVDTYAVTYSTDYYLEQTDGSYACAERITVESEAGAFVSASEKIFEHYTEDTTNGVHSGTVLADSSLVLTRYYTRNEYNLTFEVNGGAVLAPISAKHGAVVSLPEISRYGYVFSGWYLDKALTEPAQITTMPTENITVYAKWTAVGADRGVEYHINGITLLGNDYTPVDIIPNGSFYAQVSVTNLNSETVDTLVLASYDADGRMVDLYFLYANPQVGQTFILGALIDNSGGEVAELRAFMLPMLGGPMIPLANSVSTCD